MIAKVHLFSEYLVYLRGKLNEKAMIESESFRPISPEIDYSGKYTDVELICVTGHARLYRMRKAGRLFMAKTIREDSAKDVELLKREYELTLGLTHPHIVHIYAYETDTPVGPAIVMEYVDGRTLAEYLAEKPASSALRRVFDQLLSATDYLHKAGVIHNDLKPENILITRSNNDVRLIDFGFADDDSHYMHRAQGGTRGYASPELTAQSHDLDTRSDVYSLGRIMQQLFPRRWSRIAHRCLHPDKHRRYADVEALAKAWRRRRQPMQWAAMLVVAALILLPTLLYIGEREQRIQYVQTVEREQLLADSLFQVLETSYEEHFRLTLDSINTLSAGTVENPYLEAMMMIERYYHRTNGVKAIVSASATDKGMLSQLESYADRMYTEYLNQLVEAAGQWLH